MIRQLKAAPLFRTLVLSTTLAFFTLFSLESIAAAPTENRFTPENYINLGLGFAADSGIYEGQSDHFEALPIVDIYYDQFYIKQNLVGYQIGWEMIRQNNYALFFAGQYDNTHLDIGDINSDSKDLFLGIENTRERDWELGIVGHYHSRVGLIEAHYFKGLGNELETVGFLKISREIQNMPPRINIRPGMFINYKSDEFNRYYYGVTQEENVRGAALAGRPQDDFDAFRPVYQPGNSGHFGVDIEIKYRYAKNLYVWTYLAVEDITGEVEMSPLVEEKSIVHLKAGLTYSFLD